MIPKKCMGCKVFQDILESDVPACCMWFMDNVVICGDSVENCTEYEPVEESR